LDAVKISCTSIRAYAWHADIIRPDYKHFYIKFCRP